MGIRANLLITGLVLMGCFVFASMDSYAIESKTEWDNAFRSVYPGQEPLLGDPGDFPGDIFAWQGHYWVRAYVSMAETYKDASYLDRAVRLIDYMFFHRDDARAVRGQLNIQNSPYVSAPQYYLNHRNEAAPGWSRLFGNQRRIEVVTDGQIVQSIMRFVELVQSKPEFGAFRAKAQEYVSKVEETVGIHDSSFVYERYKDVPGSYYYPRVDGTGLYTRDLAINHSATMGVGLLLLDKLKGGGTEYGNKAKAILDYWKAERREISDQAYDWNYYLRDSGDEDFNHGHIDLSFINMAYRFGLVSSTEMEKLANTLTEKIYKGGGSFSNYLDGSSSSDSRTVGYDWIDLVQFDPLVLDIAKEAYAKDYSVPTWSRPFLGWAEILRWTAPLKKPMPPQNLRIN